MAYDTHRNRVVFLTQVYDFAAETWTWDGTTWHDAGYGPPGAPIAYDIVSPGDVVRRDVLLPRRERRPRDPGIRRNGLAHGGSRGSNGPAHGSDVWR